jgi:hypothetical protein
MVRGNKQRGELAIEPSIYLLFAIQFLVIISQVSAQLAWSPIQVDSESKLIQHFSTATFHCFYAL